MTPSVFRGHVPAAALLFDPALIGEEEARRRIVALWTPGATVMRCGHTYVLRLARTETMAAARAPGLPLVRRGSVLAGFDVDERTLAGLGPLHDPTAVRFESGAMRVVPLTESVEPADWLDVSAATVVESLSLGAPPPEPRVVKGIEERDLRDLLNVPPLAEPASMAGLLAALRSPNAQGKARWRGGFGFLRAFGRLFGLRQPGRATTNARKSGYGGIGCLVFLMIARMLLLWAQDSSSLVPLILIALIVLILIFVAVASRRFGMSEGGTPRSGTTPSAAPGAFASILGRLQRRRGESRWRALLTRFFIVTRLSSLIGRTHAKYLIKVLSLFEDNDLDAALRHAIPLGGEGFGSGGLAWGTPAPRNALDISLGPGGGARAIPIDRDLMEELKRRYRAAFERLDQAGRYDDAAFVLAELLRSEEEAVAYLERRGQLQKAAQLAEARRLAPDLIVRQWMIAGDRRRAIAIAKRFGAFGPAVTRLEATHRETARALRGHWGAWLADAGHYVAAIDVVWPIEELRAVAAAWIDDAIEQGGTTEGKMLVRRAIVRPEVRAESITRLHELLADESPQRIAARAAAGTALLSESLPPDLRIVARIAVRAALRDAPHGLDADVIQQLARHAHQNPLRTDLPTLPRAETWSSNTFVELVCEAADTGAMPVHAIASLTDGRVAVALGEAGVRVLSRDGRPVAHFDQPAQDLVISDARDRAIAVVRRGAVLRLARIDFAARKAAHWCDVNLTRYASDYDGAIWFAARGGEILALDATAPRLEALWHNPDFPAHVTWLARDETQLCLLGHGAQIECWRYELPSLTLRERGQLEELKPDAIAVASPDGFIFARHPEQGALVLRGKATAVLADLEPVVPRFIRPWLVAEQPGQEYCDIHLCDADGTRRAYFALQGASRVAVRIQSGSLSLADDCGRVLVFDLRRGVFTHNLRT